MNRLSVKLFNQNTYELISITFLPEIQAPENEYWGIRFTIKNFPALNQVKTIYNSHA